MDHAALAPTSKVTLAAPIETPAAPQPERTSATRIADRLTVHWRIIAAVALSTALLAWLFSALQPRRYNASAIIAVSPTVDGLSATDVMRGVDTLERRTLVASVAALATTPLTRREALGAHNHNYDIDAVVLPNMNLLRVNVEGEDARTAADIANRVGTSLGPQTLAMFKFYRVTTVSAATTPANPIFPRVGRTVLAGLLLGLVLGTLVAYTIDSRRPHLR
ncbi:MAG TPA: Wzz/FepE/Etk N-terminal domain-containing protein [Thermoanaerobaculia bacterium]